LPSLRERREDIALLAKHFLAEKVRPSSPSIQKRLSDEALAFNQSIAVSRQRAQLENLCHWLTVLAPAESSKSKICRSTYGTKPDRSLRSIVCGQRRESTARLLVAVSASLRMTAWRCLIPGIVADTRLTAVVWLRAGRTEGG
jgi:DNA-binding NtrC family response regulator